MGVIVNKENTKKTELAQRIDAELRAKTQSGAETEEGPDFAEESEYVQNLKKTGRFGWVWIILVGLAILSLISIVVL